jgi:hypothetical protein
MPVGQHRLLWTRSSEASRTGRETKRRPHPVRTTRPRSHQEADTGRAMSQENVELVRRGYEALARGDFDALFQVLDPDVEMRDAANFPEAGAYIGHRGVLDFSPNRLRYGTTSESSRSGSSPLMTRSSFCTSRWAGRRSPACNSKRVTRTSGRFETVWRFKAERTTRGRPALKPWGCGSRPPAATVTPTTNAQPSLAANEPRRHSDRSGFLCTEPPGGRRRRGSCGATLHYPIRLVLALISG